MTSKTKQILPILEKWAEIITAWDEQYENLRSVLDVGPESAFLVTIERMADAYTVAIGKEVGDVFEGMLDWYRFDCDMGKKPKLFILPNGKELTVNNLKTLAKAISA